GGGRGARGAGPGAGGARGGGPPAAPPPPPTPSPPPLPHRGPGRGPRAAGTAPPLHFAAGPGYAVDRQPAGHHDEAVPACFLTACEFGPGVTIGHRKHRGRFYLPNHLRAGRPLPARGGPLAT